MPSTKQSRIKKYSREHPDNLPNRQITDRSIQILDALNRYKFLPTSLIVRLATGNHRITKRHLQNLYHQGYVNRFAFPTSFHPGEFNYFLDDKKALDLLKEHQFTPEQLDYKTVLNNREKSYDEIAFNRELVQKQGRLSHLSHELMISRFHYMLEMACRKTNGVVKLLGFYQGSELWQTVKASKVFTDAQGYLVEKDEDERLPHRPDAFFALHFPTREAEEKTHYYFYEADRKTMNVSKMNRKFRSHFHYIVKKKQHREDYGVKRIKAVLVESIDSAWADHLRINARHPIVSGAKPSPLFWFTTSELFETKVSTGKKEQPLYLDTPEAIFRNIWATPEHTDNITQEQFLSLIPS